MLFFTCPSLFRTTQPPTGRQRFCSFAHRTVLDPASIVIEWINKQVHLFEAIWLRILVADSDLDLVSPEPHTSRLHSPASGCQDIDRQPCRVRNIQPAWVREEAGVSPLGLMEPNTWKKTFVVGGLGHLTMTLRPCSVAQMSSVLTESGSWAPCRQAAHRAPTSTSWGFALDRRKAQKSPCT